MSEAIKALAMLRDAARNHPPGVPGREELIASCIAAIAALRAEEPKAAQPSRTAVPEKINQTDWVKAVGGTKSHEHYNALHAACVTIAQERDDYWARLEACEAELAEAQDMEKSRDNWITIAEKAEAQLAETLAALKKARAEERERCAQAVEESLERLYDRFLTYAVGIERKADEDDFIAVTYAQARGRYESVSTACAHASRAIRALPEEGE